MSQKVTGQVFRVYSKTFPGKPETFSVKLEDNPIYYRLGTKRHEGIIEPGNVVEFQATLNDDGKSARVEGGVKAATQQAAQAVAAATGDRQNAISYQAARKDALVFLGAVLGADAVKLPAKQADKLKSLEDLTDYYTAKFFEDTNTLGAVTRTLEGGEGDPAPAAATAGAEDDE